MRNLGSMDRWLGAANAALSVLAADPKASRLSPATKIVPETSALSESDRQLSGALMRVNHVGEICAQALYQSQALLTNNSTVRQHLLTAAQEELDHLAWTRERLRQLNTRPSLLNPIWFVGSFAMGLAVSRLSPQVNLGFVVETERQVEAHLASHLDRLPAADAQSRAIVEQMQSEEAVHAAQAMKEGAVPLLGFAQEGMRGVSKLMTGTAFYI